MEQEAKEFKKVHKRAQSWAKNYPSAEAIPDSEIPKEYSFASIGGFDFTHAVRDQGNCGSCFAMSFTQVVESRLMLLYGPDAPKISTQFMLSCNYLNEGCEGGWSILHGFMAENGHLVSDHCAPYTGKTLGTHCGQYASCPPVAKVKSSYFIGGGYGQFVKAKDIQKEILRNGPVSANMKTSKYFKFYSAGLMKKDATNLLIEAKLNELMQTGSQDGDEELEPVDPIALGNPAHNDNVDSQLGDPLQPILEANPLDVIDHNSTQQLIQDGLSSDSKKNILSNEKGGSTKAK